MAGMWIEATLIALTSLVSGGAALLAVWAVFVRRADLARRKLDAPELEETVFLFDDEQLVDATGPARALIDANPMGASDWTRLSNFLAPRFDSFAAKMAQLAEAGTLELIGRPEKDGQRPLRLLAENVNGMARITLVDPDAEGRGVLVDALSQRALEDELELMRETLDRSPALVWREDENGAVGWANRAYILQSGALSQSDDGFVWPLPVLFNFDRAHASDVPRRVSLETADGARNWFEVYAYPLRASRLYFALPADATVRAERALRDFVQTLTKTFADLPIGLAIFDRQRQLRLFNPALIDLLQLAPDFLSARPTLYALLDRLRETRMMPEPKDYRSWRRQMTELEKAAAAGFHSEIWSLPGGQTYRVTGRPHPDGAVAFLFEDISAEISLTRRFRAELEMSQEVIDQFDDAVAVFRQGGGLALSNTAYARLWKVDPEALLGQATLSDAIALWKDECEPTPFWAQLRERANRFANREGVDGRLELHDGTTLTCRATPLSGGAMMVRFRGDADRDPAIGRLAPAQGMIVHG